MRRQEGFNKRKRKPFAKQRSKQGCVKLKERKQLRLPKRQHKLEQKLKKKLK